jgi:urea carboxylase
MEGPGGYQFTGRTIPVWNRWRKTADFGKPWLLRFFDQLRFYPVSAEELLRLREEVPRGRHKLEIEESVFRFADYEAYLEQHAVEIEAFRTTQRAAFEAERRRWEEAGLVMDATVEDVVEESEITIPDGCVILDSPVTGSVWKVQVQAGDLLPVAATAMILEAMKMEVAVDADEHLEVVEVLVVEGASVRAGQALVVAKRLPIVD